MTYNCRLSLNTVSGLWNEITSHKLLQLKRDQFRTLFVGPCWP